MEGWLGAAWLGGGSGRGSDGVHNTTTATNLAKRVVLSTV